MAAIAIFTASPAPLHAELKPEKLYQKVLPSVMTLEVENAAGEHFVGSAVVVLKDDVILTAWHVVADARNVSAVFADGERVKVIGALDQDGVRDLALLKLEKPMAHRQAILCRDFPSVASRAYVIGAPRGFDFSISDGLVSQIRRVDGFEQYQLSCPISPGNSGGPVLNEDGQVIGITSWTKSNAQNVSFAIPTREISHLNVTRPVLTWDQLAAGTAPVMAQRNVEAHSVASKVPTEEVNAGGLDDFKKLLDTSAGKAVTVVIEESGQASTFKFTVPTK